MWECESVHINMKVCRWSFCSLLIPCSDCPLFTLPSVLPTFWFVLLAPLVLNISIPKGGTEEHFCSSANSMPSLFLFLQYILNEWPIIGSDMSSHVCPLRFLMCSFRKHCCDSTVYCTAWLIMLVSQSACTLFKGDLLCSFSHERSFSLFTDTPSCVKYWPAVLQLLFKNHTFWDLTIFWMVIFQENVSRNWIVPENETIILLHYLGNIMTWNSGLLLGAVKRN